MLRLLGVILTAVIAQCVVHAWGLITAGMGQSSANAWKQNLDAEIERDFPRE